MTLTQFQPTERCQPAWSESTDDCSHVKQMNDTLSHCSLKWAVTIYLTQKLVPKTQNTWHCPTSLGEQGTNCPWRLEKQNCYWKLERWWLTSLSSKTTGKTSKCVFLAKKLSKKCSKCPLVSFSSVWGMGRGTWKQRRNFSFTRRVQQKYRRRRTCKVGSTLSRAEDSQSKKWFLDHDQIKTVTAMPFGLRQHLENPLS